MWVWLALKATNSLAHSRRYFTKAGVASPRSSWAFAQACRILAVSICKRRCWRDCRDIANDTLQSGTVRNRAKWFGSRMS
jgi:hypothetical protein